MRQNSSLAVWLSSPVVVLPAIGLAIYFASLPFYFFSKADSVADFYGSFFGAITGLAGVLVGALLNASLERQRADRIRRDETLAVARACRFELERRQEWRNVFETTLNNAQSPKTDLARVRIALAVALAEMPPISITDANLLKLCDTNDKVPATLLRCTQHQQQLEKELRELSALLHPTSTTHANQADFATLALRLSSAKTSLNDCLAALRDWLRADA